MKLWRSSFSDPNIRTIVRWAVLSRVVLWAFSLINNWIEDYDTSSLAPRTKKPLDKLIWILFGSYVKWDSIYFMRIAEVGYEYEQQLAFFPFYPFCMRFIAYGKPLNINIVGLELFFPSSVLSFQSALLLAGVSISGFAFIFAAIELYRYFSLQ